jgi:hypothetical protein
MRVLTRSIARSVAGKIPGRESTPAVNWFRCVRFPRNGLLHGKNFHRVTRRRLRVAILSEAIARAREICRPNQ